MIRFWITSSRKSISSGIILKVQHWPLSVITGENILEQSLSSPPKWHLKFKGFWWLNLSSQRLIWISASLDYILFVFQYIWFHFNDRIFRYGSIFRAVEITERPNKLFMMFLCQCSCHGQHFVIHIDSGYQIKTNIKQKLTKKINV